ncbi:hypothetical protein GOP47_0001774 [Adiantum capillus-veneris]|uniref:NB-ARC domain-containing protein n=1 Tax=Adiantum capillus-veneris TaxID=13818 RepID=A0A9D4ZQC8_ADICA|nr:hypothetical protein GOP47_0001774 [Adiantum capillus-veneris]
MSNLQKFMPSSGWELEIGLDINSWAKNLEKLQYVSGEVHYRIHLHNGRIRHQSEYDYIQVIVSNICDLLPPPPRKYLCDDAIKGGERMAQEIADSFNQQESLGADGVTAIGVYGVGGSGKTTLCKMMTKFFIDEFCGRCFYIELATNDDEVEKQLLHDIGVILESLSAGATLKIHHVDQALVLLQEALHRSKVFLAIDNVWGCLGIKHQNFDFAKRIIVMKCLPGSKILTTGRSRKVQDCLLQERLKMVGKLTNRDQHFRG